MDIINYEENQYLDILINKNEFWKRSAALWSCLNCLLGKDIWKTIFLSFDNNVNYISRDKTPIDKLHQFIKSYNKPG